MAKDYAKAFYTSKEWIKCRTGFMQSKNYICERCGGVANICHHKTYITPENIHDPNITLNWRNLEACCQACHNLEHHSGGICADGLVFDSNGNLRKKQSPHFEK
ncbi:HNH endonuclease [Priestia veravalensis]|uniref:HNH endonuclease n=1 Tax=Priestia veravalensis TaxID=1414648 RepID=A0A0V8JHL8_9BACI|nr:MULTISPECIES: hypothetical protein [Priestia]KSU86562.1 HNH endonuclease [Priestia veravalensis]